MNVPKTELNYKVGDAIKCWTAHETTKKMMELAREGYICQEEGENRLVIKEIRKGDNDE